MQLSGALYGPATAFNGAFEDGRRAPYNELDLRGVLAMGGVLTAAATIAAAVGAAAAYRYIDRRRKDFGDVMRRVRDGEKKRKNHRRGTRSGDRGVSPA